MSKAKPPHRFTRLGLVGPTRPYRGGISHYTTELKRALESVGAAPAMVSFRFQYPRWLYPGESDLEPDASGVRESNVEYILTPFSIPSWHRAVDYLRSSGCSHVVLPWWTLFWAPALWYMAVRLRADSIAVIFLCHNLTDHGAAGIRAWLAKRFLGAGSAYIVHSSAQAKTLAHTFGKPLLQRHHPVYGHFPPPSTQLSKRGRVELLFFGFIRPYKGLENLVEALADLDDPDVFLTVAGEPWGDTGYLDLAKQRLGERLDLHLGYISPQRAADLFSRADIVALPYLSASGSGVAALAYHYGKPVLATSVGGFRDIVMDGLTGWLVPPGSAEALAKAIASISREDATRLAPHIARFVEDNSWKGMATAIQSFAMDLSAEAQLSQGAR
jgi:Glycosyltransferase